MEKKGQGHIEIMLSFVIFITFVVTIFIFLNPTKSSQADYGLLNSAQEKILQNITLNYYSFALKTAETSCFSVPDNFNLNQNIVVFDSNSKKIGAKITGSKINIEYSGNGNYQGYISDRFNEKDLTENCKSSKDYSLGPLTSQSDVLYEDIVALENQYNKDYSGLKNSLGIDGEFDFALYNISRSVLLNSTLGKRKGSIRQVVAREIPLSVINNDLIRQETILLLRAWR